MLSAARLSRTAALTRALPAPRWGVVLVRWATTDGAPGVGGSTGMELETTDPLELYRGLVAKGQIKPELEQIRALVQVSGASALTAAAGGGVEEGLAFPGALTAA